MTSITLRNTLSFGQLNNQLTAALNVVFRNDEAFYVAHAAQRALTLTHDIGEIPPIDQSDCDITVQWAPDGHDAVVVTKYHTPAALAADAQLHELATAHKAIRRSGLTVAITFRREFALKVIDAIQRGKKA